MQIQEAVETCVTQKYADFDGVATRSELWFFFLFVLVINALMDAFVPALAGVFALVMLVPWLSVGTRRLHDVDRSGWWQLLWLVPVVGWIPLFVMFAQAGRTPATPVAPAAPTPFT